MSYLRLPQARQVRRAPQDPQLLRHLQETTKTIDAALHERRICLMDTYHLRPIMQLVNSVAGMAIWSSSDFSYGYVTSYNDY